jgi:hypothetical protein
MYFPTSALEYLARLTKQPTAAVAAALCRRAALGLRGPAHTPAERRGYNMRFCKALLERVPKVVGRDEPPARPLPIQSTRAGEPAARPYPWTDERNFQNRLSGTFLRDSVSSVVSPRATAH